MRARLGFHPNGYLLVTVASWGLNFVAVKEAYRQIEPPALALLRFVTMWGALAAVCVWRGESLKYPREDALKFLHLGLASMGVYMLLFLEGMRGSAATEGAILLQLSPIFTAILAALFRHERLSVASLSGALVAFAGTGLIVYSPLAGQDNKLDSNLLVVCAAFLWAYSVTIMRPLLQRYSPLRVLTLSMVGGAPVMLAYGLLPALRQDWRAVSPYTWVMFAHISVVSGVVAFLCFYQGVRQIGGSRATLYQFLVPVAAMLFSFLIQRHVPTVFQVSGMIVVLTGVGFASYARRQAQLAV